MEKFARKGIIVPVGMKQIVEGRDTVMLNAETETIRLVFYIDSMACSSCRLNRMFVYSDVVDYRKTVGDRFSPLFVFSPPHSKVGEVMRTLEFSEFAYPVFIDEHGAFPAANPHIPADSRFHTFLLDKNGKVVVVGDPVNNPDLWELYKKTIAELIANGGTLPITERSGNDITMPTVEK
jgi:hypothetical protein